MSEGLGHRSILDNEKVAKGVLKFIEEDTYEME